MIDKRTEWIRQKEGKIYHQKEVFMNHQIN
jgi:hypothetical protein